MDVRERFCKRVGVRFIEEIDPDEFRRVVVRKVKVKAIRQNVTPAIMLAQGNRKAQSRTGWEIEE